MLSQAHPLHHDPLEMPDHVVGQEECAELAFHFGTEFGRPHEHLVAMRPGNPVHFLRLQKGIDLAAGAAIAIDDGNAASLAPQGCHLAAQAGNDTFGVVMP